MPRSGPLIVRWLARVLTVLLVVIVALALFSPDPNGTGLPLRGIELLGLALFPVGLTLGTVAAWRWHRAGSLAALGCLAGFYLYNLLLAGRLPTGPWFAVMAVPAVLWLWLSFMPERRARRPS